MRNKCLLGLGLVFVISLTSMVAFAFSFTGTPADEVDETEMIVRAVVSEEADAMPTTEPITTTRQEQEMVKKEQSKIGSMDWDSDDAYRLAKIAMAEAESEDTEGKALVMAMMFAPRQNMDFPINGISNTDTGVNSFPQNNTEETDIFNDDLWADDSSDNDSCDDGFDNGEEN